MVPARHDRLVHVLVLRGAGRQATEAGEGPGRLLEVLLCNDPVSVVIVEGKHLRKLLELQIRKHRGSPREVVIDHTAVPWHALQGTRRSRRQEAPARV